MIKIVLNEKKKVYYNKLSVFDFDGTLFKSPEKPSGYKGNWWAELKSLTPPTVPNKPGKEFWFESTLNSAREELDTKKTYCILLTGRIDNVFDERVRELLSFKKLNFDYIKLNSFGSDTGEFKTEEIRKILRKNPTIKKIEMWDDEQDKIDLYTEKFSENYDFKINKVLGSE